MLIQTHEIILARRGRPKEKGKQMTYNYPRPSLTSDVVLMYDNYILLVKRKNAPFKNYWALPGGFMNLDETTKECAARELFEETNVALDKNIVAEGLSLIGVFDAVNRDSRQRTITVAYGWYVLGSFMNGPFPSISPADDALECDWVHVDDILSGNYELAFDHHDIVCTFLEKEGRVS